jgi:hypothetical protein
MSRFDNENVISYKSVEQRNTRMIMIVNLHYKCGLIFTKVYKCLLGVFTVFFNDACNTFLPLLYISLRTI